MISKGFQIYRKQSFLSFVTAALLLQILLAGTFSAVRAESVSPSLPPPAVDPEPGEFWVSSTNSAHWDISVSNGKIAYNDLSDVGQANVIVYDTATGERTQITTDGGAYHPKISGNRVVWEQKTDQAAAVFMHDLSTGQTRILSSSTSRDAIQPDISGDKVVWYYTKYFEVSRPEDVMLYDLSTDTETQLSSSGSTKWPRISGDNVVWTETASGHSVHWYSISTGELTELAPDTVSARIDGDRIAWHTSTGFTIYNTADRSTNTYSVGCRPTFPEISGDKVIYHCDKSGNEDIYIFDLANGQESQVTTHSADQLSPAYSDGLLAYTDKRNPRDSFYADIYAQILEAPNRAPEPIWTSTYVITGGTAEWIDFGTPAIAAPNSSDQIIPYAYFADPDGDEVEVELTIFDEFGNEIAATEFPGLSGGGFAHTGAGYGYRYAWIYPEQAGAYFFRFVARDSRGAETSANCEIRIKDPNNNDPMITSRYLYTYNFSGGWQFVDGDQDLTVQKSLTSLAFPLVYSNDADGDAITFIPKVIDQYGNEHSIDTLDAITNSGNYNYSGTAWYQYLLFDTGLAAPEPYTFKFRLSDGRGGVAETSLTVNLVP